MSDIKRIVVRTDEQFHARLVKESEIKRRSLNGQVLEILATYFDAEKLRLRLRELERTTDA